MSWRALKSAAYGSRVRWSTCLKQTAYSSCAHQGNHFWVNYDGYTHSSFAKRKFSNILFNCFYKVYLDFTTLLIHLSITRIVLLNLYNNSEEIMYSLLFATSSSICWVFMPLGQWICNLKLANSVVLYLPESHHGENKSTKHLLIIRWHTQVYLAPINYFSNDFWI